MATWGFRRASATPLSGSPACISDIFVGGGIALAHALVASEVAIYSTIAMACSGAADAVAHAETQLVALLDSIHSQVGGAGGGQQKGSNGPAALV